MRDKHKEELGLDIPLGYFSKSKMEILDSTVKEKTKVFYLRKRFYYWSTAAVVAIMLFFSVFNPFKQEETSDVYNDVLIATLAVNDNEIDVVVDEFIDDNLLTSNIFLEEIIE